MPCVFDLAPCSAIAALPLAHAAGSDALPGFVFVAVLSADACLCANLFTGCRAVWKSKGKINIDQYVFKSTL